MEIYTSSEASDISSDDNEDISKSGCIPPPQPPDVLQERIEPALGLSFGREGPTLGRPEILEDVNTTNMNVEALLRLNAGKFLCLKLS